MSSSNDMSIWDKIGEDLVVEPSGASNTATTQPDQEKKRRRRRRYFRILDAIGFATWLYFLTKIFIVDIDRLFIEAVAPQLVSLLDYRLLGFLGILAIVVICLRKKAIGPILYVGFFPLVVLFFKVPMLAIRRRSWVTAFGIANVVVSIIGSFKFYLIAYTTGLLSIILIVASSARPVLASAVIALSIVTIVILFRSVRLSLQRSRFLEMQKKAFLSITVGKGADLFTVQPALKRPEIEKFDKTQLDQFTQRLSMGLFLVKGVNFWLHQLNNYRRSAVTAAFGLASYVALFIQTLVAASFVNWGILKMSPASFSYQADPSFLKIIDYSLSALFVNSIDGLVPTGGAATLVKVILGIIGPVLLATLALHLIIGQRESRQQNEIQTMAQDVRRAAVSLEEMLVEEYGVSTDEALARLRTLGANMFVAGIDYMASRLPGEPVAED